MIKKIATITFHWANNYGAVLQAYALQQYLIKQGCETEIINYLPLRVQFRTALIAIKNRNFEHFKKSKNFKEFRKKELLLSKKAFRSNKQLHGCADDYAAVIVGSDQIWNSSFFKKAEYKPTLSYFLNFAGNCTKRISYAASFGATNIQLEMQKLIKPELDKFVAVSVRENTAVDILNGINVKSVRVVDPTLLLEREDYSRFFENKCVQKEVGLCTYLLHKNHKSADMISDYVFKNNNLTCRTDIKCCSIYQWLSSFANAEYIVTNSFHGTVLSIMFRKPFITVSIPGSGMNDRLATLLGALGLSDRLMDDFNSEKIDLLLKTEIDWESVENRLSELKEESQRFLSEALK